MKFGKVQPTQDKEKLESSSDLELTVRNGAQ